MVKHYWKVRMFHGDIKTPIDLNCTTRKDARKYKKLHKGMKIFREIKIYKITPFIYPNPLVTQKGLQCEYMEEVR